MSTKKPIYDRAEAPTECLTDLVLLLAEDDAATYDRLREQLDEIDLEPFPFELDIPVDEPVSIGEHQPNKREPFESLELLDIVDYVETHFIPIDVDEPVELTAKGRAGAAALRAGLDDDQAAALDEVIST